MAEFIAALTYGQALFEVATELNKVNDFLGEGEEIIRLLESEPDFNKFLCTPVIAAVEKKETVEKIFHDKISDEMLNLIFVIIDKGRARHFKDIIKYYKRAINESEGFSVGTIYSAKLLGEETITSFEEQTSKLLRKKVRLKNKLDTTVIGGVKIFVEGKVIDATIKTSY